MLYCICGSLKQVIDGKDEVEVGYRINDAYWSNGYGTEAAEGCLKYARYVLRKESIISLILAVNKQSIRVAEKNGMKFEKEAMFQDQIHQVYRLIFERNNKSIEESAAKNEEK